MRPNELQVARDASSMLPMGPDTESRCMPCQLQRRRSLLFNFSCKDVPHEVDAMCCWKEGRDEYRDLEALKESLRAEAALRFCPA